MFESFVQVLKAVANPRRLELLELMAQDEHNVEPLAHLSAMGMTTASAHLQQLKRTGLVTTRRERATVFDRMAGDGIAALYTAAKTVAVNRYPQFTRCPVSQELRHPCLGPRTGA
ncbi:ArsR/SmtB family transcription factor [Corynebacterium halotolerans]|uniref:ArsR family transcriptional regulator n=1 Tax=Corynebacterium halotolerans YIM 70093 = DSM 44683 TaxID=1121362 RepID=M1NI50_9CORY|nr:ArsR family transcriptional regulator [Corynebacterium halotolerans YIM 70093 = DSM 44683]